MQTRYTETKHLMGTEVTVIIDTDNDPQSAIHSVFQLFEEREQEFSRFQETSSLSKLNKERSLTVSDRFRDIVLQTKQLHAETNGFFNPLIQVAQKGYSASFETGTFQPGNDIVDTDMDKLVIEGNTITLAENQQLDLGGIIKGATVDGAASYLQQKGYHNFIVDAGGDMYIAGHQRDNSAWSVGIDDPVLKGYIVARMEITDRSVSTSGRYKRYWKIGKKEYHHILNPLTDDNEKEIMSITIIHPLCTTSDSFATACFNMGITKALAFLPQHGAEGLIVDAGGAIHFTPGLQKYSLVLA